MSDSMVLREVRERLPELYKNELIAIEHERELLVLETRLQALLERVAAHDAPSQWQHMHDAYQAYLDYKDQYERLGRDSDLAKMQRSLVKMGEILSAGYVYEFLGWKEIRSLLEQIRRTKDSEISRRAKAAQTITERQVTAMINYVINSIARHVSNDLERERVLNDLSRMNMVV